MGTPGHGIWPIKPQGPIPAAATLLMSFLAGISWKNALVDFETFFAQGRSPSQREGGLELREELLFRYLGAHLIQRAGRLLKMYTRPHPRLVAARTADG